MYASKIFVKDKRAGYYWPINPVALGSHALSIKNDVGQSHLLRNKGARVSIDRVEFVFVICQDKSLATRTRFFFFATQSCVELIGLWNPLRASTA